VADGPDPLVPRVPVGTNSNPIPPSRQTLSGYDLPPADRVELRPAAHGPVGRTPMAQTDKTHQNTWWREVRCRAYEEDGDMRAWGRTGGTTGPRPNRTSRPGHRGLTAERAPAEIGHAMAARRAWW
jgi:hypothetical protein